ATTLLAIVSAGSWGVVAWSTERTAESAAHSLQQDLRYARQTAIQTGRPVTVRFGDYRYELIDSGGICLTHPLTKKPYRVDVREISRTTAWIGDADFDGSRDLVFQADGTPVDGGQVLLKLGSSTWCVKARPLTGRIAVVYGP
ncbi:MAG: GspH/FimT family protein, partial [Planctomycetota bacterium]